LKQLPVAGTEGEASGSSEFKTAYANDESRRRSTAQVALAYLLTRPAVTSVIIGARTEAQLVENLASADLRLEAEDRNALDRISVLDLQYPYWYQAAFASERLSPADAILLRQAR
jgi:aryl-alcohol dehydrogenase-like predicted oxidoreductase